MTFNLLQSNYSNSFGQYLNQSQQLDINTNNITVTAASITSTAKSDFFRISRKKSCFSIGSATKVHYG